jgi:MFS transporter, PAT family, beta-lactamase induction signal transducer AmpG
VSRFVLLSCLYFAQGLPFGFFSHAVPVLLNREHPPEIAGLSSLLAIPWGFKFLFAPLVDRVGVGRRRWVIFPMQLGSLVVLLVTGSLPISATRLGPLLAGFFLVSLFSALQDVATDALSIDVLRREELGFGATVQAGAYRAGMIAGGGGVLAMIDALGFRDAFYLMAAALLITALPLVRFREADATVAHPREAASPPWGAALGRLVRRRESRRLLGFLLLFKLGDSLAAGMVTRWFVKQGLSTAEIAWSRGLVGGLAGITGAVLGGLLVRRVSFRRGLQLTAGLQASAVGLYLALAWSHPIVIGVVPMDLWVYTAASVVEHVFGGAATAALFAHMMASTEPESRATDFTAQACMLVLVTGLGLLASGFVVKAVGLTGLFALATALGVASPFATNLLPRRPSSEAQSATLGTETPGNPKA